MTFTISEQKPAIQILHLDDILSEFENKKVLKAAQERLKKGFNLIVLDMTDLNYINSVGLNLLITLRSKTHEAGGDLAIVNPSEQVISLLEITKLKSFFNLIKSIDEAVEHLASDHE